MRKLELDDQGRVNLGPVAGAKVGKVNVAFDSQDVSGIALNVEATPAAGSAAACIKLGNFTIGQDPTRADSASFDIVNAAGVSVFTDAAAGGADTQVQFNDGSALNGSADLIWDSGTSTLSVSNAHIGDDPAGHSATLQAQWAGIPVLFDSVNSTYGAVFNVTHDTASVYGTYCSAEGPTDSTGLTTNAIASDDAASATALYSYPIVRAGKTAASTYGHWIDSLTLGAGAGSTLNYGLYVADQTGGATNYAIKTGLGLVDLGENLKVAKYIEGAEMTAPAAPAANGFRLYAEDDGAGKTRLMVKFATGAAQQVAIQP